MASRVLSSAVRTLPIATPALRASSVSRSFQTSSRRLADSVPLPARKPVGAFRGGLLGFALGCTLAGAGVYSYVLQEYKASNELLTEDIYNLQTATQRMSTYLSTLEEKIETMERKSK